MKIAIAQINSILGNIESNLENHLNFCRDAINNKSDIIVFPELSLTGYSLKDINFDIAVNLKSTSKLEKLLALSEKIDIVCGFVEEDDNYKIFNSSLYLSGHKIMHHHRKIYLPTYGIFEELRYFSKGSVCNSFETNKGTSGMLICEDMWHISLSYILAMDGAKIIYGLAASPTRLAIDSKEFRNYEINSEHHKTFARLLSVYFIFANRVGYEDGVNFWGGSEIIDPFGNVLVKGKLFEEDLLFADIDMNIVKQARHQARHFLDEDIDNTLFNLSRTNLK